MDGARHLILEGQVGLGQQGEEPTQRGIIRREHVLDGGIREQRGQRWRRRQSRGRKETLHR